MQSVFLISTIDKHKKLYSNLDGIASSLEIGLELIKTKIFPNSPEFITYLDEYELDHIYLDEPKHRYLVKSDLTTKLLF